MDNKKIIEQICGDLHEHHKQNRLEWKRKDPTKISIENQNGEISLIVIKQFKLTGWEVSPAYFSLKIDDIIVNIFLSEFPNLKVMAEELVKKHFQDLDEDNQKATDKILEFSKSLSLENYRERKINKILNINEQR